jgi:sugar lactone lactonase YvrE
MKSVRACVRAREPSTRCFKLSRLATTLVAVLGTLGSVAAQPRVAPDWRLEVVATQIPRPAQLAIAASGNLIVLSHGWRGDAAAEIFDLDPAGSLPLDVSRAPRVVIPFAGGPRRTVFGSLAVDPRTGDLFLGEENGNRISRLAAGRRMHDFAVGLQHLVGGGAIALDARGRLVVLDYTSPETRQRSESPLPPSLEEIAGDGYQGPLVFRLDPRDGAPLPRRLDLLPPLFPRAWTTQPGEEPLSRFISVAALPGEGVLLLDSLGQLFRLTPESRLARVARLPAGHFHRTNMAVAPDGTAYVSSGFHIRGLYRVSAAGVVESIARELGDPAGIAVDRDGAVYVAETALHRIVRLTTPPASPR